MKSVIVQKFGGTSLGQTHSIKNVIHVMRQTWEENPLIVVVSAMSGTLKEEGTTARLMRAAEQAVNQGNSSKEIDFLQHFHENLIEELEFPAGKFKNWVQSRMKEEFTNLRSFIDAISVIKEMTTKSCDVILSFGERLSATILTAYANAQGIEATLVDTSKLMDSGYAAVNFQFLTDLRHALKQELEKAAGTLPVVTGFIGQVPNGILEGIGRGYSDFTAAAIAASLAAKELQIWKEVDGIYSADPRKVNSAYVLPTISPEEAAELTFYGSEVVHPFTMEQVVQANIPTRIKNTWKPELSGTVIDPSADLQQNVFRPIAVTCKRNVNVLHIRSNRMLMSHGFMAKVFKILEQYEIVIDLISTSEVSISITTVNSRTVYQAMNELKEFSQTQLEKGMSIISLVGSGMKNTLGTAGKMFQTLAQNGINIEMITQGASEVNISCVVCDEDSLKALRCVHDAMLL